MWITSIPSVRTVFNGINYDIERIIELNVILKMEFEEIKLYKEITGKKAVELLLSDEPLYTTKELVNHFILKDNKVSLLKSFGERNTHISLNTILQNEWYTKR